MSLPLHSTMERVRLSLTADILCDQLKEMAVLVRELRKGIKRGDWFMVETALAQLDEDIATWTLYTQCVVVCCTVSLFSMIPSGKNSHF